MAEIICVIGNKGGTGKTTLSHMLCQGLGLLGQRAACVLTGAEGAAEGGGELDPVRAGHVSVSCRLLPPRRRPGAGWLGPSR